LPSISLSASWSCRFQIYIQYSLGILFSSILCTCPNQCNLCSLIVCVVVGFFNNCINFLLINILQLSFSLSYTGPWEWY
jgi:hypothetical protein